MRSREPGYRGRVNEPFIKLEFSIEIEKHAYGLQLTSYTSACVRVDMII